MAVRDEITLLFNLQINQLVVTYKKGKDCKKTCPSDPKGDIFKLQSFQSDQQSKTKRISVIFF